jgi:hypothetical protein
MTIFTNTVPAACLDILAEMIAMDQSIVVGGAGGRMSAPAVD